MKRLESSNINRTRLYLAVHSVLHNRRLINTGGAMLLSAGVAGSVIAMPLPVTPESGIYAQPMQSQKLGKSLVIIDSQLEDNAILSSSAPIGSKVYRLDINKDGIEQISEILKNHDGLTNVHFLSHGGSGYLSLGNTILKAETINYYKEQIQGWQKSLSAGADLLFYGCETGSGAKGAELLDKLAELTGADVAGSTNVTGSTASGGDWDLEYKVGGITASNLQPKNYPHTLLDGQFIVGDGSGGGGGGGGYFYASELDLGGDGGAGGGGDDIITGTVGDDVIVGDGSGGGGAGGYVGGTSGAGAGGAGGGGADAIYGGSGNDILIGDGFDGADGNMTSAGVYFADQTGGNGGFGGGGGGGGGNYASSSNDHNGGNGGIGAGGGGGGDYGYGGDGGIGGGGGGSGGSASSGYEGLGGGLGATDGTYTTDDAGGGGGGGGYFGTGGVGAVYTNAPTPPSYGGSGGNGGGTAGTGNTGNGGTGCDATGLNSDGDDGDYSGGSGGGGFGSGNGGASGCDTDPTQTLGEDGSDGDEEEYSMPDTGGVVATFVMSELPTLLANHPNFGAGADVLDGGPGSDQLVGLGGNDRFVFELDDATSGTDTDAVWDLNSDDMLEVTSGGIAQDAATITAVLAAQVPGGIDRTITVTDGSNSMDIVVKGISRDLVLADFVTNDAPTASAVSITDDNAGSVEVGDSLTGGYTYADVDSDLEGTSTFRWLRDGAAIAGATALTYTLDAADAETAITFEVTPVAATGATPGDAVESGGVIVDTAPIIVVEEDDGNGIFGIGSFSIWSLFIGIGLGLGRLFRLRKRD